jgi:hypothetical protein
MPVGAHFVGVISRIHQLVKMGYSPRRHGGQGNGDLRIVHTPAGQ